MVRNLLIRGMLVGFVAGLLVFGFSKVFGEPTVERAIAFESAMDEARTKGHSHTVANPPEPEPELVSREVQASYGLFVGIVTYCAAFGGLFALVFAFAHGRIGGLGPRATSALLAGGGFIAIYVVPSLKYPANPPSVGEPETIGYRTALFFVMIALSVAGMVGAIVLRQRLVSRLGPWSAALTAIAAYAGVIVATQIALPGIDEVPVGFPATVLWDFRIASLGMQFVMWASIGLLFGWLTERSMAGNLGSPWLVPFEPPCVDPSRGSVLKPGEWSSRSMIDDDRRHAAKMAKRKAVQDAEVASKTIEAKGLLMVHTGPGKGKSTSAFGLVLRALGHGWRVGVVQFIKGAWQTGERRALDRFADLVEWHTMGDGFTWETQDRQRDIAAAENAWKMARKLMADPEIRLLVLDELNIALRYDYLPLAGVLAELGDRRDDLNIVVTGRNAKPELIAIADLVTEMGMVKHHFAAGVKAQRGIEF